MLRYQGNGLIPDPYAWWQAGALWGAMIDYWKYTGDAQFNGQVEEALLAQTGPDNNYLPLAFATVIGNDDQGFWAMSAMLAAETGFQDPPPSAPQWLTLAIEVHSSQKRSLHQETLCGGGLRWQINMFSPGYDYKNSISNALYFNVAARLAHYTGKEDYASEARSMWEWLRRIGLIDAEYNVWDGVHFGNDCKDMHYMQLSYQPAVLLQGAAFMWSLVSYTPATQPRTRTPSRPQVF